MRILIHLLLGLAAFPLAAQPVGLSHLLSLTTCADTTCMAAFADSAGFCQMPGVGNEEDGWIWFTCAHIGDGDFTDPVHMQSIGYFGYAHSYYREYITGTRDTTFAAALTEELGQLGFTVEKPIAEGHSYRSTAYPGLHINRLEKRATNVGRDGIARKELMWVFKVVVPQR